MPREFWPQNIHVAHLVIDATVDIEWVRQRVLAWGASLGDRVLMNPSSIAETYWQVHRQPRNASAHELDL